jgi:hypothetical protein
MRGNEQSVIVCGEPKDLVISPGAYTNARKSKERLDTGEPVVCMNV